jgi:hypothetical protein
MGLLSFLTKPAPTLVRLPAGSFTVDRAGCVLASTLSSSFPDELVGAITRQVLGAFHSATEAQLPLAELTINYPSLKITARELRGGAILFLSPKTPYATTKINNTAGL